MQSLSQKTSDSAFPRTQTLPNVIRIPQPAVPTLKSALKRARSTSQVFDVVDVESHAQGDEAGSSHTSRFTTDGNEQCNNSIEDELEVHTSNPSRCNIISKTCTSYEICIETCAPRRNGCMEMSNGRPECYKEGFLERIADLVSDETIQRCVRNIDRSIDTNDEVRKRKLLAYKNTKANAGDTEDPWSRLQKLDMEGNGPIDARDWSVWRDERRKELMQSREDEGARRQRRGAKVSFSKESQFRTFENEFAHSWKCTLPRTTDLKFCPRCRLVERVEELEPRDVNVDAVVTTKTKEPGPSRRWKINARKWARLRDKAMRKYLRAKATVLEADVPV